LVYLLPSRKTYSTRTTCSSVERTIVSKNWIKQLHTSRYCTSTAVYQLKTVKQQHTSTATSILTTKAMYHSLSAQRLSECTVCNISS
jgi:hypothetical protein